MNRLHRCKLLYDTLEERMNSLCSPIVYGNSRLPIVYQSCQTGKWVADQLENHEPYSGSRRSARVLSLSAWSIGSLRCGAACGTSLWNSIVNIQGFVVEAEQTSWQRFHHQPIARFHLQPLAQHEWHESAL